MIPIVHVHPQAWWHAPATIVGNTAGLRALYEAVTAALAGDVGTARVFAADGEGYALTVVARNADLNDAEWEKKALPYTDEMAQSTDKDL